MRGAATLAYTERFGDLTKRLGADLGREVNEDLQGVGLFLARNGNDDEGRAEV